MIAITMTRDQFECVKKFASAENVELKKHDFKLTELSEDGLSGHVHTKEVDASFSYNEEANTLVLDNETKHGMYGFVSDSTIGQHLQEVLGELECSDIPAHVENLQAETGSSTAGATTTSLSQFVKPVITL